MCARNPSSCARTLFRTPPRPAAPTLLQPRAARLCHACILHAPVVSAANKETPWLLLWWSVADSGRPCPLLAGDARGGAAHTGDRGVGAERPQDHGLGAADGGHRGAHAARAAPTEARAALGRLAPRGHDLMRAAAQTGGESSASKRSGEARACVCTERSVHLHLAFRTRLSAKHARNTTRCIAHRAEDILHSLRICRGKRAPALSRTSTHAARSCTGAPRAQMLGPASDAWLGEAELVLELPRAQRRIFGGARRPEAVRALRELVAPRVVAAPRVRQRRGVCPEAELPPKQLRRRHGDRAELLRRAQRQLARRARLDAHLHPARPRAQPARRGLVARRAAPVWRF
jgi:hypothetical protein